MRGAIAVGQTLAGRVMPTKSGRAALFLAHRASAMMSAQGLTVDGG